MASAEKTTVTREVVKVVEEEQVVLTLSIAEARALKKVAQRVGGPTDGPRGLINNIEMALYPVVGHVGDGYHVATGSVAVIHGSED